MIELTGLGNRCCASDDDNGHGYDDNDGYDIDDDGSLQERTVMRRTFNMDMMMIMIMDTMLMMMVMMLLKMEAASGHQMQGSASDRKE